MSKGHELAKKKQQKKPQKIKPNKQAYKNMLELIITEI